MDVDQKQGTINRQWLNAKENKRCTAITQTAEGWMQMEVTSLTAESHTEQVNTNKNVKYKQNDYMLHILHLETWKNS